MEDSDDLPEFPDDDELEGGEPDDDVMFPVERHISALDLYIGV